MKIFLLSLTLVCGACHSADHRALDTGQLPSNDSFTLEVLASPPLPDSQAEETLPRFNHLDRAKFAVRAWVRDRS